MKHVSSTAGLAACALSFFFSATILFAQTDRGGLDLADEELFPAEFFPDLSELSEAELLLAGLRSLYPERIVTELPENEFPDPQPPVVREIGANGAYIRVKHLPEALGTIKEHLARPLLVLDFRFLATDLESTLALGSLLTAQEELRLDLVGNYPESTASVDGSTLAIPGDGLRDPEHTIFTLSNRDTRGPIEALLGQLKADQEIISVGDPSRGQTATFRAFPGLEDSYYLISGEIRPADGSSLVESGFVPQVSVEVTPEDDRVGYGSLREGVTLDDLVQARTSKTRFDEARLLRERNGSPSLPEEEEDTEESGVPQDPILRRALNIVKALQALGKIPQG